MSGELSGLPAGIEGLVPSSEGLSGTSGAVAEAIPEAGTPGSGEIVADAPVSGLEAEAGAGDPAGAGESAPETSGGASGDMSADAVPDDGDAALSAPDASMSAGSATTESTTTSMSADMMLADATMSSEMSADNPHDPGTAKHGEHMAAMALVDTGSATHVAVASGDWFDPATWGGTVPGAGARVWIPEGLSVGYGDVSDIRLFTVRVDGELAFATDTDTRMVLDTMVVTGTGRLEIGTAADPVAAGISAEIVIAKNGAIDAAWDPMLLSRGVIGHGAVEMHGAAKETHLKVVSDPMAGDSSITLAEAPVGWQVGDKIVIAGTHYNGYKWDTSTEPHGIRFQPPEDEIRTITAINGTEVFFDQALVHDHDTPRADLKTSVANYSRSITIATEDHESAAVGERGHVMFMHSDAVDVRYVALEGLGRTDKSQDAADASSFTTIEPDSNVKGRYALHVHRAGLDDPENPAVLVGNAVWTSPGWGIVHHDSNAVLHANATYDTFGAGFVAESGNETGTWTDNIAIFAQGISWAPPKAATAESVPGNFDLGRSGDGFWFQGRMVEASGNVAASVNAGFVYFHRGDFGDGKMMPFEASLFAYPEMLYLAPGNHPGVPEVIPDRAPILLFADNEAFAAQLGLTVVKANPQQHHDVHSHLKDFTAWSVLDGVDLEYTGHYTLENFDLTAREAIQFLEPRVGLTFATNTIDMTVIGARIAGFAEGIRASKNFTPDTVPDPADPGYAIIGGTFANNGTDLVGIVPGEIVDPAALVPGRFEVDLAPMVYTGVAQRITGTVTDSLGSRPIPTQGDFLELDLWTVIELLERDGWYEAADGRRFFVLEMYYSDRATAELHKIGHLVEIDPAVPLGNPLHSYVNARFAGSIDLASTAPVAMDDAVQTAAGVDVVIDPALNDTDPEGAAVRVDGVVQPAHGRVVENADGTLTYRPDIGFAGIDSFRYWVTDGQGNFTPATVTVEVRQGAIDAGGTLFDAGALAQPGEGLTITVIDPGSTQGQDLGLGPVPNGPMAGQGYDIAGPGILVSVVNATGIIGSGAGDTITGGAADEVFDGAGGDDVLEGGGGLDTVLGQAGNDILSVGEGVAGGVQAMFGHQGDDRYVYRKAAGEVQVATSSTEQAGWGDDRLVFQNLALSEVMFSLQGAELRADWSDASGSGHVLVGDGGQFIESFEFADGSTIADVDFNWGALLLRGTRGGDDTITGGAADEYLYGYQGNDVLDAGGTAGGLQALYGHQGDDTYVYGRDSGRVLVATSGTERADWGDDRLIFSDLALADVSFSMQGTDLRIDWADASGASHVLVGDGGQFIETFEFADGSTIADVDFNWGALLLRGTRGGDDTITGGAADEYLYGYQGNDVLDAGGTAGGLQALYGHQGDDTYVYGRDSGRVLVATSGTERADWGDDRLIFSDLALADVSFSMQGTDLRIDWADASGASHVLVGDGGQFIESFEFADGSTIADVDFNWGALLLRGTRGGDDTITGGAADEYLYGYQGNDVLDAGGTAGGLQALYGHQGDDTYVYGRDSGRVLVATSGTERADWGDDRLIFSDLALADVSFSMQGTDLRIDWADASGASHVLVGDGGQFIESFEFADGSTIADVDFNWGALLLRGTRGGDDTITGGAADEYLYGYQGNDVLDAGGTAGGLQALYGHQGDDTYVYGRDSGRVLVATSGTERADWGDDRLIFSDLALADVSFSMQGTDLRIDWADASGASHVLVGDGGQFIETFVFADGAILGPGDLLI